MVAVVVEIVARRVAQMEMMTTKMIHLLKMKIKKSSLKLKKANGIHAEEEVNE